jgi:hypothetical protein
MFIMGNPALSQWALDGRANLPAYKPASVALTNLTTFGPPPLILTAKNKVGNRTRRENTNTKAIARRGAMNAYPTSGIAHLFCIGV